MTPVNDHRRDTGARPRPAGPQPPVSCPSDVALLDFHGGRLDDAACEEIRDHLASCAACVVRARDARDFVETVDAAAAPPGARRHALWIGLAAALVACVAALAIFTARRAGPAVPRSPGSLITWRGLAIAPPPYRPPTPGEGGDFVYRDGIVSDPFVAAMQRYAAGDYAAAESALEAVVAAHPADTRARFYLAITRLAGGRADDARRELERLERSAEPSERDAIAWYLSLALLECGRLDEARTRLELFAGGTGPHAAEARNLLERLERKGRP